MNLFLQLAYLFFLGSLFGWVLELVFRKFFSGANPEHKWINPGFCVGPYVPLYGTGLCVLYLLSMMGAATGLDGSPAGMAGLLLLMAVSMTVIEYIAGILLLKLMHLRLWDYSTQWGNVQGLICPLFSLFWGILGAAYYFFVNPYTLQALRWLQENLAFSFVIGYFFGVFTIDLVYSAQLVSKLKAFAEENDVVIRYENLKAHIRANQERAQERIHFFMPFRSEHPLAEHLASARERMERLRHREKPCAAPGKK